MPGYVIKDSWLLYGLGKGIKYVGKNGGNHHGSGGGGRGSTGFSYAFTDLIIYRPILDHLLNDPTGQVGVWLHKQGEKVVAGAKRQVGVKTGKLRESIYMEHNRDVKGQYLKIGSNVKYAYAHHEGTKPHIITPTASHKTLRFSVGTRIIYTRRVMHPGTRPNRFLKDSLKLIEGVE